LSTPAASTPLPAPETAAPAKSVRIVLSPPGPATPGVQGAGAQSSDPRAPLLTAQYSGAASLGPARSGDVESPQAGTSSLFSVGDRCNNTMKLPDEAPIQSFSATWRETRHE
jgi:hypothetical protein